MLPVLIDEKLTKPDCFKILEAANIKLPAIYSMGYPNANCIGCVKSSSPTYWRLVKEKHPEVFNERAAQSRQIGCKLIKVKGDEVGKRKRIYLDELTPEHKGGKIKSYECGIFCDTK